MTNCSIRICHRIEEFEACVELQKRIWGYAEGESYAARLFVNLSHIGGHVLGAFTVGGELVGFVAAMPAWRDGVRYYHSLSLGVAAGHENLGLGRALKFRQREEALAAGIERIEWTFDPMRAKNAFFNLVRLGAVARRYRPDYYGRLKSKLQQGLPTDRLICEWWLKSERVARATRGEPAREPGATPAAAEVAIPTHFRPLAESDPEQARDLQLATRGKLIGAFAQGLVATGFTRGEHDSRYLLDHAATA